MKHSHIMRGTLGAAAIALGVAGTAHSDVVRSVSPQPGDLGIEAMSRYYDTSTARIGTFPGRLVCSGCDLTPGVDTAAPCENGTRPPVLSMEGESLVHPLLVGMPQVVAQISSCELSGKPVAVHGKYYPTTGAILVDRIEARD